jgi:hypothetical protein
VTLQKVLEKVTRVWPRHPTVIPPDVLPYYSVRSELSVVDGLLTYADRIVIPQALHKEILLRLHQSHQEIQKCRENARSSVWWPGISSDLKETV